MNSLFITVIVVDLGPISEKVRQESIHQIIYVSLYSISFYVISENLKGIISLNLKQLTNELLRQYSFQRSVIEN